MKIKTDGEIFLDYLQKHFEGNQRAFAEYAKKKTKGLGPQSISVLCRQTKFSKNDKEKLEKAGLPMDMFNSEIAEVEKIENEQTEITNVIIVPAVVAAGNGSLLFDDENFIREYIEHLGKQTHYRFLVSGDSMHPTIPNGSYIYTIPVLEVSKNNVYVFHMKAVELKTLNYTLYSWKHTGAIALYNKTKDIKKIMAQMRHASISETDNYLRDLGIIQDSSLKDLDW